MTDTEEVQLMSRRIAFLALESLRQEAGLNVRQTEQLRRAFAKVGEELDWDLLPGAGEARVDAAAKDISRLADTGAQALELDLKKELAAKKAEITELGRVMKSFEKMADDAETAFPVEVEYSHTARNPSRGLFTKTETVTLGDAAEARSAAAAIEKRIDRFEKLRDEMLEDIERRRRQVREMRRGLDEFVASSKGLVGDVLAILA